MKNVENEYAAEVWWHISIKIGITIIKCIVLKDDFVEKHFNTFEMRPVNCIKIYAFFDFWLLL